LWPIQMTYFLEFRITELKNCQIVKLKNCQIAELPNCQIAELKNSIQLPKFTFPEIIKCLFNFFVGIHEEGAIGGYGLIDGLAT